MLSQQKDTDKIILEKLTDRDLLSYCKIENKYIHNLCNEEFFKKRVQERYPGLRNNRGRWKRFFFNLVYWTAKLKEDFGFEMDTQISPPAYPEALYDLLSTYEEVLTTNGKNTYFTSYEFFGLQNPQDREEYERRVATEYMAIGAEKNRLDLVNYFIDKGADDYVRGFYSANSEEMAEYFLNLALKTGSLNVADLDDIIAGDPKRFRREIFTKLKKKYFPDA